MALMSYKCPNCGGGLVFDPDSQKFQCEYCLSEFTEEEMKRMEEASASCLLYTSPSPRDA